MMYWNRMIGRDSEVYNFDLNKKENYIFQNANGEMRNESKAIEYRLKDW